jgi:hypothetical protein
MPKSARITLVGGPGDGQEFQFDVAATVLHWKAVEEVERITARTMGRPISVSDPVTYRRSLRTRSLFVYQP